MKIRKIMLSEPKPTEEAVKWIEYAVETGM